jgi:large subunit ribosomal protein L25
MENFMMVKAESRHEVGKKIAKKLRKEGKIPAIIYGDKKDSIPITLSLTEVKQILKAEMGENTVLKIQRDDMEVDAMVKEIQWDYLSDNVIHADFLRIDLNKPVFVGVPVHLIGEAIGVRVEDGLLDFMTRELKVKCLPAKIPMEYVVDITDLHVNNSIKAEEIELGEDIQLVSDSHTVICAIATRGKSEEEEEVTEEEGVEEEADVTTDDEKSEE